MPFKTSCQHCGREYTARRTTSKYCGATCRKAAQREREQGGPPVDVPTEAAKIRTALDILTRASDDQLRRDMWHLAEVWEQIDDLRDRCIELSGLTRDEAREFGMLP